jgi:hypothetical protein
MHRTRAWDFHHILIRWRHRPYLWITSITILLLATLYPVEDSAVHRSSAKVAPWQEPIFSPPGGYYDQDIQLKINAPALANGKQSDVLFTLNGSVPTRTSGTIYTRPVQLSADAPAVTVVRARAVLPDDRLGPVVSASYFVGIQTTLPVISLIIEPDDLWHPEHGIYTDANQEKRGIAWERPVDVTYVDKDRRLGFHVPAGLRIHGGASRTRAKKALRLCFRQEYGVSRLEYPLFADSEVRSFKRLVLHNGGQDWCAIDRWNWTLMRNQLIDRLALDLGGYATHSQPSLLFINGQPWGIYHVRERIDEHFLADHYNIESADLLESPEYGRDPSASTEERQHWDHLVQFVETHSLTEPANYAYVQSQVDIENLIDYCILQIYAANIDWPHNNVHQFRSRAQGGRWQWMFWDSDYSLIVPPHSHVDSNLITRIMDFDHPRTGGRDVILIRKLLENPAFFKRFLSRTADVLNTTLLPQSVTAHIDALAAELGPNMYHETIRWSGTSDWETNVQELYDFARRRPEFVRQHLVERFGLNGTAQLTFNTPAGDSGYVAVNGTPVPDQPWQGIYFQGIPIQITAIPAPGHRFAGWDPPELPQTPTVTLTVNATQTIMPRFEVADGDIPRPGDVIFAQHEADTNGAVEGDWFELQVTRPGGVDLRGWRVTDNDTKTAMDEGSLIFSANPAFAHVPQGTTILIIVNSPSPPQQGEQRKSDDLNTWDRQMVLYTNNDNLDINVDPGLNLGPNDNLVLLAPGSTQAFEDDQGIAFVADSTAVTPASFGVLADGVLTIPNATNSQSNQRAHAQPLAWLLILLAGSAALYLKARRVDPCRNAVQPTRPDY